MPRFALSWLAVACPWLLLACALPIASELEVELAEQALASDVVHMQIVAHQDDDFLFMNPDLSNAIKQGHGIVTVYLTAGQAAGFAGDEAYGPMCAAEFAAARQRGIRAAYARMTGAANPEAATWKRELLVPDAGVAWPHTVERFTYEAQPRIKLIFMNIPDGGAAIGACAYPPYTYALSNMFADAAASTDTIVPDCSGSLHDGYDQSPFVGCMGRRRRSPYVCDAKADCSEPLPWQRYDHAGVVAVLRGLVNMVQPQVVRTLDPRPFQKLGPPSNVCPVAGYDVCFDNADHTSTAQFVDEVLAGYQGPNGRARYDLVQYKGYSAANYPANVGLAEHANKGSIGSTYALAGPDPNYLSTSYDPHYRTMYERFPGSTTWLERTSNGRLVAVAVRGRRIHMWHEQSAGGAWTGPVDLGSSGAIAGTSAPASPHVTLVKRPDGRLAIFALRVPVDPRLGADVITAVQTTDATPAFGAWTSLGAPAVGLAGPPAAAYGAGDRTFVLARDGNGQLVVTVLRSDAATLPWAVVLPLMQDIVDGIATATADDGRARVFVTLRSGRVVGFVQSGDTLQLDAGLEVTNAASAPTVAKNQDGRLEIFYRERVASAQAYGRVLTMWMTAAGSWAGPSVLYGDAGVGPIAALRREGSGHIMLLERNTDDRLSLTFQQRPNDVFHLQWLALGTPRVLEYPALATDALGRVVLLAKSTDGRMLMRRETSAGTVGAFGAWQSIGN